MDDRPGSRPLDTLTKNPQPEEARVVRVLAAALLLAVAIIVYHFGRGGKKRLAPYSVGYQIAPHYLGTSTWKGDAYALSDTCPALGPGLGGPDQRPRPVREVFAPGGSGSLVYNPPFTQDLRGSHPNWWRPDGGSYGLPPAADRPDFWAQRARGEVPTIHTIHARDPIPPLCEPSVVADGRRRPTKSEEVAEWRFWGGPKGWHLSPFY